VKKHVSVFLSNIGGDFVRGGRYLGDFVLDSFAAIPMVMRIFPMRCRCSAYLLSLLIDCCNDCFHDFWSSYIVPCGKKLSTFVSSGARS